MKKNRKLMLAAAAILLVMSLVAGTYAWFTAKDDVTNHFETAQITDGSVNIVEVFDPPTEWKPGQEITKEVSVANTGSGDVLVRMTFEEVLNMLPAEQNSGSPYSGTGIPVLFAADAYLNSPYVNAITLFGSNQIPTDITVMVKMITNGNKKSYNFVALHKININSDPYDGKYQKVTADFTIDSAGKLIVNNEKYYSYSGYTTTTSVWKTPTCPAASAISYAQTDASNKYIQINYNDGLAALQSISNGKWFYNANDGYFYYIGKVGSGQISPALLKSIELDKDAGAAYAGLQFDLKVSMEAIQNTIDAVESLWNINSGALYNALMAFCE